MLAIGSYYYASNFLDKSIDETSRAVGSDYAHSIEAELRNVTTKLEGLANTERMRNITDQNSMQKAMYDI